MHQVDARQRLDESPQGNLRTHGIEQLAQLPGSVPVHQLLQMQGFFVIFSGGVFPQGLFQQILRVVAGMYQSQYIQAGLPEIAHRCCFVVQTLVGRTPQKLIALPWIHVVLNARQGSHFPDLPVELTGFQWIERDGQGQQVDIPVVDIRTALGLEEPFPAFQRLVFIDDLQQMIPCDTAFAV